MSSYANYGTPAEFDAGYANSITPEVVARWEAVFRADSDATLAALPVRRDLAYGPGERNRVDFFPAAVGSTSGPAPTLVAIHGGLWCLFDKWMMHFLAGAFTARGFNVAAINYGLAPARSLTQIVADCRAAVRWVYERADELGVDRARISLLGHSAAGQLAAVVAGTRWDQLDAGLPPQIVHRLVGVSGFYDIEPVRQTGFHDMVRFPNAEYREWNPLHLVAAHHPPALLLIGERESPLLHAMMHRYAAALGAVGVPVQTVVPPDECHFSVLHRVGDLGSAVFEGVKEFLSMP